MYALRSYIHRSIFFFFSFLEAREKKHGQLYDSQNPQGRKNNGKGMRDIHAVQELY